MSQTLVFLFSVVLSIITSIIASIVFLMFASKCRPQLEISEVISMCPDLDSKTRYAIKVINKTKKPIVNVKARMFIAIPHNVSGGTILVTKYLQLKTDDILEIQKYNRNDENANYAVRFVTYDALDELWEGQGSHVKFQIYATHSISGFGKTFAKSYHEKRTCLVEGNFAYGDSVKVV